VLAGALPHAKSNGMPFDVKVVGDHAYVANWEYDGHISYGVDGLLVVDVSDPASPSPAGYLSTAQFGRPGRIAASGSRVFFPVRDREVWVLDAVNPTSPRLIGIIAGPAPAEDVSGTEIREIIAIRPVPDDEIAVVHESRGSDGEDGLYWRWVDIRDPVQPRDIASRATSGYVGVEWPAAGLIWDDRLAITTNRLGDFRVLGGIDRQRPYVAGGFPVRVFAEDQDVAVSEAGVVYVLTDYYRSALHVLDVRDPGQPRIKGTMLLGDVIRWGGGIAEHRGYVFISDYDGVRVIDARVPAAMREVARTEGLPGRLVVADRFAYLASPVRLSDDLSAPGEPGGLRVIDVRDPVHPLQLGYVPGDMTAVATDGRMIWVGAVCEGRFGETACVQAYDVSAPEQPMLAGQFIPPFAGNRIEDIVVGRGFAFVTESGSTSWHVFDIADPARIRLLRTYRDGWGARLALRGTTLFLGGGDERLRAFDVRDPPHLRETASFAMPDPEGNPVVDVSFAGDVVLAGTARAGLWLFDVRDFSGAR